MAWKMVKVKEEVYERISKLCNRWNLSVGQVIERLLQLYDAYLESDNAAQSVVNALEETKGGIARSRHQRSALSALGSNGARRSRLSALGATAAKPSSMLLGF